MYNTEIQKQFIKSYVIDPQRFDKLCSDTQYGLLIQKVDNSSKGVLIIYYKITEIVYVRVI